MLASGDVRRSERVVLYVARGEGPARATWVTGRRVGTAVARNRARRILREAWRTLVPKVADGHDVVLVARGPLGSTKTAELAEEIERLLRDAGLIRT